MSLHLPSVYLAGPITGLTYDEGQDWRDTAREELQIAGIEAFSPLRAKQYLRSFGVLDEGGTPDGAYLGVNPISDPHGVLARDHYDCQVRDMILVYLVGAERVSIGSVMEIAWAFAYRKPLVCAMEPDNPHRHMMVNEACSYIVDTLDQAIDVCKAVLLP